MRIKRRNMREANEATRMVPLRLLQTSVDQPACSDIRLIESRATGEYCNINACAIHHCKVCRKIRKQRIKPVVGIAVFVETHGAVERLSSTNA